MKSTMAILLLFVAAGERDFVTTVGEHTRFDGKLTLKVYEQGDKLNYRVCHEEKDGLAESGPSKPGIEKGSKWFIYARTDDEVWIYDGGTVLILRPFHDRRKGFPSGGFYQLGGKRFRDVIPDAVWDRLPDSMKADD
jgi:hypothetical protein